MVVASGLTKRYKSSRAPQTVGESWASILFGELGKTLTGSAAGKEIVAIDNLSFSINEGEIFGLLGSTGAGKTTLMKCLACLVLPDGGEAWVNGKSILADRRGVKACISLVKGGSWLGTLFTLSVRDNLLFYASLCGIPRRLAVDRADEVIRLFKLESKQHELAWNLSAGERQKIPLAQAFMVRTPVVLLDEPTVHLDPMMAQEVRRYVREYLHTQFGQTVLLTTHYPDEAEMLCSRVGILEKGRLIALDTPANLKRSIADMPIFVLKVTGLNPEAGERLAGLKYVKRLSTMTENPAQGATAIRVRLAGDVPAPRETICRAVCELGGNVTDIRSDGPTLEDVFFAKIGGG